MTDGTSEQGSARRPRRAVRTAGTVGDDDSVLLSRVPAVSAAQHTAPQHTAPQPPQPSQHTADRPDPAVALRSADDSDVGWGGGTDSNDDRLREDKPPHW